MVSQVFIQHSQPCVCFQCNRRKLTPVECVHVTSAARTSAVVTTCFPLALYMCGCLHPAMPCHITNSWLNHQGRFKIYPCLVRFQRFCFCWCEVYLCNGTFKSLLSDSFRLLVYWKASVSRDNGL